MIDTGKIEKFIVSAEALKVKITAQSLAAFIETSLHTMKELIAEIELLQSQLLNTENDRDTAVSNLRKSEARFSARTAELGKEIIQLKTFSEVKQDSASTLAVWYGSMPESNGKTNWTAILYHKNSEDLFGGICDGFTIDRSEYPDRVRYEADRVRYLIGAIDWKPSILDYDSEKVSDYVK